MTYLCTYVWKSPALVESLVALGPDGAEAQMLQLPQAECSVIHRFGPGIYIRELSMKAGTFAVGHRQKHRHYNVLLKGKVKMFSEGAPRIFEAPLCFTGEPGRKFGLVLKDTVWQNIYATDETDIDRLEAMLLDKSAEFVSFTKIPQASQADRLDYAACIAEYGFTQDQVTDQVENEADQIAMPEGDWKCKVSVSPIHGLGLFATAPMDPGEQIAPMRVGGMRTPAGRFTNHSMTPNAVVSRLPNGDMVLIASAPIAGCRGGFDGDEILIDYRQALSFAPVKVEAS